MVPEPWEYALLVLAAFRVWKLIADDRILDRPREWALEHLDTKRGRTKWEDFITCPWCAGFWISAIAYSSFIGFGPGTFDRGELLMGAVVLMAISGGVGSLGTLYYAIADD